MQENKTQRSSQVSSKYPHDDLIYITTAINMSLNNPMKIKRDWLQADHLNSFVCVCVCTCASMPHQAETPDDHLGLSLRVTAGSNAK